MNALAATLIAIVSTRLEILSIELEEEWMWLSSILTWSLVALFCGGLGIVFSVFFFVLLLWDTHRLLALGIPAALFILAAGLAWWVVVSKAKAKPKMFAASLAELAKDREQLTPRL